MKSAKMSLPCFSRLPCTFTWMLVLVTCERAGGNEWWCWCTHLEAGWWCWFHTRRRDGGAGAHAEAFFFFFHTQERRPRSRRLLGSLGGLICLSTPTPREWIKRNKTRKRFLFFHTETVARGKGGRGGCRRTALRRALELGSAKYWVNLRGWREMSNPPITISHPALRSALRGRTAGCMIYGRFWFGLQNLGYADSLPGPG